MAQKPVSVSVVLDSLAQSGGFDHAYCAAVLVDAKTGSPTQQGRQFLALYLQDPQMALAYLRELVPVMTQTPDVRSSSLKRPALKSGGGGFGIGGLEGCSALVELRGSFEGSRANAGHPDAAMVTGLLFSPTPSVAGSVGTAAIPVKPVVQKIGKRLKPLERGFWADTAQTIYAAASGDKLKGALLATAMAPLSALSLFTACGDGEERSDDVKFTPIQPPDAGKPDVGKPDTGAPDSGTPDSGKPDTATPDSGIPDSGAPDADVPDTGAPDSGMPDAGTCSAVNCHSKVKFDGHPDFGLAPAGSPVSLSHPAHVKTIPCESCHDGYTDSHSNGTLEAVGTVFVNGVQGKWNDTGASCSGMSCHGGGVWGDKDPKCTMCHDKAFALAPAPDKGAHPTHADKMQFGCSPCHNQYQNKSTHRDGKADLSGIVSMSIAPNAVFSETQKTCNNLNCHGDGNWYDKDPTCGMCHGGKGFAGPKPTEGSHPKHVDTKGYTCPTCHDGYQTASTHRNGNLDHGAGLVIFDGKNPSGVYTKTDAKCTGVYCHGPGPSVKAPVWGGQVACGDCHSTNPASGSHAKHVSGQGYTCDTCHAGSGAAGALHGDFKLDVVINASPTSLATGFGQNAGNVPVYSAGTKSCSGVYCHSNGASKEKGGVYGLADIGTPPNGVMAYGNPVWGGQVACGDCHPAKPLGQISSVK
ncbi:MAG: CxxxxCH/CxxCH domain-containing protein, partial [Elusimicrobiota bacterium]